MNQDRVRTHSGESLKTGQIGRPVLRRVPTDAPVSSGAVSGLSELELRHLYEVHDLRQRVSILQADLLHVLNQKNVPCAKCEASSQSLRSVTETLNAEKGELYEWARRVETEKLEILAWAERVEGEKSDILSWAERAEREKLEFFGWAERVELEKLDCLARVELAESEQLETVSRLDRTESEKNALIEQVVQLKQIADRVSEVETERDQVVREKAELWAWCEPQLSAIPTWRRLPGMVRRVLRRR